jgi:SNF2 family DNA or RNA helicase
MTIGNLPNGRLYHSPLGLFGFQEEGVAYAVLAAGPDSGKLAVWDTGIGKTHLAMATSAMLFELEEIDLVVVVCEGNKVDEWVEDYAKFTALDAMKYHGQNRRKKLDAADPQVIVSTYETMRDEGCKFLREEGKHGVKLRPGPLLPYLQSKRVLLVYDEITKLRNRTSGLYKGHYYAVTQLRRARGCRVMGLTATPMDTTPENLFNLARIIDPDVAGKVADFEKQYTLGRDEYGRYQWKTFELPRLAAQLRPIIMRKRKSDPDVIDQFPRQVEESHKVLLLPEHAEFYETVAGLREDIPDSLRGALWTVKRMVAGYPESLALTVKRGLETRGHAATIAQMIVDEVGDEGLKAIPSSKTLALLDHLDTLVRGQSEKVLVFTFFGPTIGALLARDMRAKGFKVFQHHPPMSREQMAVQKNAFRKYEGPAVLLSSDAGARGMNIPEASYVIHYEMPLTFSNYRQRADRNHRIDSKLPSVTSLALIAVETVEEDIAEVCMDRNDMQDTLIEDIFAAEAHVLAAERRERLRI